MDPPAPILSCPETFRPRPAPLHAGVDFSEFYKTILGLAGEAAYSCGYGLGVHGSQRRDLDLLAVPWILCATSFAELAETIAITTGGLWSGIQSINRRPHGRLSTSIIYLNSPRTHDHMVAGAAPWIDLSGIQPASFDRTCTRA